MSDCSFRCTFQMNNKKSDCFLALSKYAKKSKGAIFQIAHFLHKKEQLLILKIKNEQMRNPTHLLKRSLPFKKSK